jgi:hypothetical protein
MTDCRPASTPLDPGCKLSKDMCCKTAEEETYMRSIPYLSAVRSLMYPATGTHPDIAYAVGALSKYNSCPGPGHWTAVQHVFRYLRGTMHHRLTFSPAPDGTDLLVGFSDADYAGSVDTRRSTTGYVFFIGSGPVSWGSKCQPTVALSSTEAEYMALVHSGKEAMWLSQLLRDLGYEIPSSLTLMTDSQPAEAVAKNPKHHTRMKHIDVSWHWIRDQVEGKEIGLHYVQTDDMVSDVLTKGLGRTKHEKFCEALGLSGS